LVYPVADIDVNTPYVTGNFAVDVDLLKRLKDSGYRQLICDEACVRRGGRNNQRGRGSFCISITFVVIMQKIDEEQNCNDAADCDEQAPRAHERPFFRADSLPMKGRWKINSSSYGNKQLVRIGGGRRCKTGAALRGAKLHTIRFRMICPLMTKTNSLDVGNRLIRNPANKAL
jgi:hypothetical protein